MFIFVSLGFKTVSVAYWHCSSETFVTSDDLLFLVNVKNVNHFSILESVKLLNTVENCFSVGDADRYEIRLKFPESLENISLVLPV